jgi:putative PIN family toxin of toxin-antitoxin system
VRVRRVVLDTSVMASALRSRTGASLLLLRAIRQGRLVPLVTPALFYEYEAVARRHEQLAVSGLRLAQIDRLLNVLAVAIEPVEVHVRWRPQLRDADDELVLEAAINGRAEALVTHNVRDFQDAARRFGIRVERPAECLKEIRQ